MLRILHIISGDLWAGAEVMAYTLLKELAKYDDIDLHVLILNKGELAERLKGLRLTLQYINENELPFIGILAKTIKVVRSKQLNIIHSHRYKENILAYLVSLVHSNKLALVATQHGMQEFFSDSNGVARKAILVLNNWLLSKKFQKLATVSNDIRKHLTMKHHFSPTKIMTIHNGIDMPERNQINHNHKEMIIGSAGRFFPVKDFSFLIDVTKEVVNSGTDILFRIAGGGPQFIEIETKVKKYGLIDRVNLPGFIEEMDWFYRGLDVYINTSLHEGIPMSVLEAMAHGLPVIAPKVGGFKEIIKDGVEGFLVEARDPAAFARKCILLSINKDLWTEMSLAARRRVQEEFSAERMALQYYELYKSVVS